MEEKYEIMNLLQSKQTLTKKLNDLIYGSVEIREKDSNKYIYVHYREDGILLTKYVGEYSDNLYNLIKDYPNLVVVMESTSIYHLPVENYFRSNYLSL